MKSFKAGFHRRVRLLQSQAVDAHPFWIFTGCLALSYALAEIGRAMLDAPWMYAFGMAIEITGVLFVAVEIASVRKLVGKPGFIVAAFSWISKFRGLFRKPKPITINANLVDGGDTFFGRGRLTQGAKSTKLSDRVDMLEKNLSQIHKELDQIYNLFDEAEKGTASMINERTNALAEKIDSQSRLISEIAAGDSATKLVGVFLVLLGFIIQNFPRDWAPAPLL
jgi:hypothetical protein